MWVVEQDFHGNFLVNVTRFFAFSSGVLDSIVLILVWFERSLNFTQVSGSARVVTGGSEANGLITHKE